MAQSVRIKEMEEYVRRIGELLNLVYKKVADTESKINTLEADVSRLRSEVEALRAENIRAKENIVSKEEYEEFMNRLVDSLKGLLPQKPAESTPEYNPTPSDNL